MDVIHDFVAEVSIICSDQHYVHSLIGTYVPQFFNLFIYTIDEWHLKCVYDGEPTQC